MRVLLWLYPRGWRRRYHAEMEAMLDETPVTLRSALDLALGVLDAHLHPPHASPRHRAVLRALGFLLLLGSGTVAVALGVSAASLAAMGPLGPLGGRLVVCAGGAALALATRLAGARLLSWYCALLAARLAASSVTGLVIVARPPLAGVAIVADAGLGAAIALAVLALRARLDRRTALFLVVALSVIGPNLLAPDFIWTTEPAYLEGLRYAIWAATLAVCAASRRRPGPGWDWPAAGARVPQRPRPDPDAPALVAAGRDDRPAAERRVR